MKIPPKVIKDIIDLTVQQLMKNGITATVFHGSHCLSPLIPVLSTVGRLG